MNKKIPILTVLIAAVFTAGCIDSPPYIVKEDMNGDGIVDDVVTEYDSSGDMISILLGGANESFAKKIVSSKIEEGSTIVLDLNKDGKQDIIYRTTYIDGSWMVLYGEGDGTFEKSKKIETSDMQFAKNSKSN